MKAFADAITETHDRLQLHLCMSFAEGEPQENADAFLQAFGSASSGLKRRTTVWPDGDSLELSHELAKRSRQVLLVNGANRELLGNHWFGRHAKRAIDENLHRRSWVLAAQSYMLNNFGSRGSRNSLKDNVRWIGGEVKDDEEGACVLA